MLVMEHIKTELEQRTDLPPPQEPQSPPPRLDLLRRGLWLLAAAVIIVLLILLALWIFHGSGSKNDANHKPAPSGTAAGRSSSSGSSLLPGDNNSGRPGNTSNGGQRGPSKNSASPSNQNGSKNLGASNLSNSGPGDTLALFTGVTLAAAGLHYVVRLRRAKKAS